MCKEMKAGGVRSEIDPKQVDELEQTRGILSFWESQLRTMLWNTTDEEGHMTRNMNTPHRNALKIVGLNSKEVGSVMHFPGTRRELLDRLGVRVIVFPDRVEVKAVFNIDPVDSSLCNSGHRIAQ